MRGVVSLDITPSPTIVRNQIIIDQYSQDAVDILRVLLFQVTVNSLPQTVADLAINPKHSASDVLTQSALIQAAHVQFANFEYDVLKSFYPIELSI